MLSECPHFQLWIRQSVARMVACSAGERALTAEVERMQRLSSCFFDDRYSDLTRESAIAVANLLARFQKAGE